MKDNLSIVISMVIFVILIVIFPLYNYFERQDDMSYNLALKTTTNFVDEVTEAGYLDQDAYNRFVGELSDTGNVYDIQLEAHRKVLTEDKDTNSTYNEQYLIDYNDQIFSADGNKIKTNLNEKTIKDNAYYFNEGDQFYVKLKNSNTTMAGAIFNTIVPSSKKDRIVVNYGGIIKNQAWAKVDATYKDIYIKSNMPTVTSNPESVLKDQQINPGTKITFTAESFSSNWWGAIKKFRWIFKKDGVEAINTETNANNGKSEYEFTPEEGTWTIEVYAINMEGAQSEPYNGFFIAKSVDSIYKGNVTGMIFDKSIYLENIDNFYVDSIEFDLNISGHSSSNGDKWYIREITGKDSSGNYIYGKDIVPITWTSNGTGSYKLENIISSGKKIKGVQLFYKVKSNHSSCLNNTSRLNYSVKYKYSE